MLFKRIACIGLIAGMAIGSGSVVMAEEYLDNKIEMDEDELYNYILNLPDGYYSSPYGFSFRDYSYEEPDYSTPVIVSPSAYKTILASDMVKIEWKYTGSEKCVVIVQDEKGNISQITAEDGNKARIMPNKLAKGGKYILTVKAGDLSSEPFELKIADKEREIVEIVSRTPVEPAEERISRDLITPDGAFDSKETANNFVKTIYVNVWQIDKNNQKVTKNIPITINAQLANTVSKIFAEIYANNLRFPIKSAGGYNYRNTASGRLSEHALGTAIDINPDENYQPYSDGTSVGNFYKPYENPYSLTPEIINIFRKYNFEWGGSFGDYMHFSYFGT